MYAGIARLGQHATGIIHCVPWIIADACEVDIASLNIQDVVKGCKCLKVGKFLPAQSVLIGCPRSLGYIQDGGVVHFGHKGCIIITIWLIESGRCQGMAGHLGDFIAIIETCRAYRGHIFTDFHAGQFRAVAESHTADGLNRIGNNHFFEIQAKPESIIAYGFYRRWNSHLGQSFTIMESIGIDGTDGIGHHDTCQRFAHFKSILTDCCHRVGFAVVGYGPWDIDCATVTVIVRGPIGYLHGIGACDIVVDAFILEVVLQFLYVGKLIPTVSRLVGTLAAPGHP